MIFFFVTARHHYTFSWFKSDWASEGLNAKMQIIPYRDLTLIKEIVAGTFIFSDLERLNSVQMNILQYFCDQLVSFDNDVCILNHPRSVLSRYNLLRKLYDVGLNRYNVYPALDPGSCLRFPLFLRMDNDHDGPRSTLLENPQQGHAKILRALMSGADINHLIQVEFCETRQADGYYRKYSAFRIGEHIIPAHIVFDTKWIAKEGEVPDTPKLQEQTEYIRENPHREKILEIFNLAGIKYGRIDYSMLDNTIQTWEINTNPILIKPRAEYPETLMPSREALAKTLIEGFLSVNSYSAADPPANLKKRIPLDWDSCRYI